MIAESSEPTTGTPVELCNDGSPEQQAPFDELKDQQQKSPDSLTTASKVVEAAGRVCGQCTSRESCQELAASWQQGGFSDIAVPVVLGEKFLAIEHGRKTVQEIPALKYLAYIDAPSIEEEVELIAATERYDERAHGLLTGPSLMAYKFIVAGNQELRVMLKKGPKAANLPSADIERGYFAASKRPGLGRDVDQFKRLINIREVVQGNFSLLRALNDKRSSSAEELTLNAMRLVTVRPYNDSAMNEGACRGYYDMYPDKGTNAKQRLLCLNCSKFGECGVGGLFGDERFGIRTAMIPAQREVIRKAVGIDVLMASASSKDFKRLAGVISNMFMEFQEVVDPAAIKIDGREGRKPKNYAEIVQGFNTELDALTSSIRTAFAEFGYFGETPRQAEARAIHKAPKVAVA